VFVLRDVEGLSSREIAYVLRCTTITVRRHSATARLKLREALRSRFPGLLGRG
jgi:DNA-directed RNA polymerase specialized sigma24 family protein